MYIWIVNICPSVICGCISFPSILSDLQCRYVSWAQPVTQTGSYIVRKESSFALTLGQRMLTIKETCGKSTTFRLHTWWQCHLEVQLHTLHVLTIYNKMSYWQIRNQIENYLVIFIWHPEFMTMMNKLHNNKKRVLDFILNLGDVINNLFVPVPDCLTVALTALCCHFKLIK